MSKTRIAALAVLLLAGAAVAAAPYLAPSGYKHQFRDLPDAPPSRAHLLGTDALGRDRWARVLYGTRVSLALAPLAAGIATLMAALLGSLAGYFGGKLEQFVLLAIDLFLCVPWLFLLITVRAALPLNVPPETSVAITFLLLGLLGWAASARVVCSGTRELMNSEFVWQARASGFSGLRLVRLHLIPNLRPILLAQFWISVPLFIITEANLGMLGLGVTEPLPSLGSLLRELQATVAFGPHAWQFVPLVILVALVSCFQTLLNESEVRV